MLTSRGQALTEQGQITDRYIRAVDQLGSDKGLDVRIGGIYALERVARDSARDHPAVMELLTAFIREHSHEPQLRPSDGDGLVQEQSTRPDVQAAITVVRRRDAQRDILPIDLTDADLTGADLTRARLTGADLTAADLTGADLTRARLTGADLTAADLTGAHLDGATLTRAGLNGATLDGATLDGAHLHDATLDGAHLDGAHLDGAHLDGADLTGADLTRADLTGADLTGAWLRGVRWPEGVPVPKGWERDAEGRLKYAGRLSEVTAHYP